MFPLSTKDETQEPDWPTNIRARLGDGRLLGTDNSVWLYRAVPLAPVVDGKTGADSIQAAEGIMRMFEELSSMTRYRVERRRTSRGGYRQIHMLLVNLPQMYTPSPDHPIAHYLHRMMGNSEIDRRVLQFGVRLQDSLTGQGWRHAVESTVDTLRYGGVPISDYDADYKEVQAAFSRSGLRQATSEEFSIANAWWNFGLEPDVPMLVHSDHLHFAGSADAARIAVESGPNCDVWPRIPNHHAITFATVREMDLPVIPATSPAAWWVPHLLARGAVAISIRGLVEPSKVTAAELRKNRKAFQTDIAERVAQGKMDRADQDETLAQLTEVEGIYQQGAPPTLAETRILVALSDRQDDLLEVGRDRGLILSPMLYRQRQALVETQLCSPMRATPHLHDLPAQSLAFSGLPSLSTVGDRDGALVGFTERDRQPAYLSPAAASTADGLPLCVVVGQTGSGKLLINTTKVPTPSGWTTMGELRLGDRVFGRDGKTCSVTAIFENPQPELFDVHFSDGQVVRACRDHQWVVSSFWDRQRNRTPKHTASIGRWDEQHQRIEALDALAEGFDDSHVSTVNELYSLAVSVPHNTWQSPIGMRAALRMVDVSSWKEVRRIESEVPATIQKTDPVVLYRTLDTLCACVARWQSTTGGNAIRWRGKLDANIAAARSLMAAIGPDHEATIPELIRLLVGAGSGLSERSKATLRRYANDAGVAHRKGVTTVTLEVPQDRVTERNVDVYPTRIALKGLALRVAQNISVKRPTTDVDERVLTTAEMIDEGVINCRDGSNFSIALAKPVDLTDVDVPVAPYVLGVWLGDGSSRCGTITQGETEECTDRVTRQSDQAWLISEVNRLGTQAHAIQSSDQTIGTCELTYQLRQAGVLGHKHIPITYQRSSISQRLALLQGLMDTDGSIDENGSCALDLCDERLAHDALELIRGLGIKCSMTSGPATISEEDPDNPGQKRRRVTGTRWRMNFTTTTKVFRLPRKLRRLKDEVRSTQGNLYITDIVPVPSEPGRCITVDSADSTYLVEQFIPTHNTIGSLWLADQMARAGAAVVFIDPKPDSPIAPAVTASGGQVASLDVLTQSDGVFDPIRFMRNKESAVEMAASVLMQVNVWGDEYSKANQEVPLIRALGYGVSHGATCTGEALKMAHSAGEAPAELVEPVFDLLGYSPMFRACVGETPGTTALKDFDGMTLIQAGAIHPHLPKPGSRPESVFQRVAMALVRMMVYGSATAVTNRPKGGVVFLDEAWVVLRSGREEVEQLGRMARSMKVLPVLMTQRVTDATRAGLAGYISRGLILPITDEDEAIAACELFKLEPTADRIGRIMAEDTIGSGEGGGAPNWNSMRHLRDERTRETVRGAVAIYADLRGRAVPVEMRIPPEFVKIASTNPDDVDARRALEAGEPG